MVWGFVIFFTCKVRTDSADVKMVFDELPYSFRPIAVSKDKSMETRA